MKDLKKILSEWDEVGSAHMICLLKYFYLGFYLLFFFQACDGCLEKADFIKRIEELKPKHVRSEL